MNVLHVGVFCASTPRGPKAAGYLSMARRFGVMLGREGFHCVNGGANGMMKELSEGVREGGGLVHCVTLDSYPLDHDAATSHESHAVLSDRQLALIGKSDAFVTLPGGFGSLYESAEVLARMALDEIDARKPNIIVGPEWRHLELLLRDMGDNGLLSRPLPTHVRFVYTIEEALLELTNLRARLGG